METSKYIPHTVYTTYINAPAQRVWDALTSAEFSRQYFSGFAVEMEPKVGGAFAVHAPDGALHISGEVIAHEPPRKLAVTWNVNWPGILEKLGVTLVTYEMSRPARRFASP